MATHRPSRRHLRYIDAGRRIGAQAEAPAITYPARARRPTPTTQTSNAAAIHSWTKAHGHPVSDRGRIPAAVRQSY